LELKVAEGYSIDNDQRKKISTRNAVLKEIANLEALIKVLYPEPPKPAKKEAKKDSKKDCKKDGNKKEVKQENKPNKSNDKKQTPVSTNGNQAKKSEKKTTLQVQQNGTAANKSTEKSVKADVKTKAQAPKTQVQPSKTQGQPSKAQAQKSKPQPKGKSAPPVIEISIEAAKRVRNLKKRLKTIEELELKLEQGEKIDKDQRVKVSKKSEVLAEILGLESGKLKV